MSLPNLIHPIPIKIQTIDRAATVFDNEAREPLQQAARHTVITVNAQINFISEQAGGSVFVPRKTGPGSDDAGYALMRYADLNGLGVTLQFSDRIVKIGKRDCDYYVTRLQDVGHYMDQDGASMVRAYFIDRDPARIGRT